MAWLIKLAAFVGPKAVVAAKTVGVYLMADPAARKRLIALLDGVPRAVVGLPLTKERRLRRGIENAQAVSKELVESATDPTDKEQAAGWLSRADRLQGALATSKALKGSRRKKRLHQIEAALDALIAEMIEGGLGGEGNIGGPGTDL